MPPTHQYRERDYVFANTFLTLRTTVGLTQASLATLLGVSRRAVENWEQGLTTPKAEHLTAFLELCVRHAAFTAGHEEEQIRAFWQAARQKMLLDEYWLSDLLAQSAPSPSGGAGQDSAAASGHLALWTVPFLRNPHFTGREELLSQLERELTPRDTEPSTTLHHATLTQAQAIKGLGGIGKTQTAIEYAYRAREQGRYTHTLWIAAASEEAVLASFAALTERIPVLRQPGESDERALANRALRWLEQRPEPWLLIYDNADETSFLPAYLPTAGRGSLLFTTRASAVGALAPSLEVDTMPLEESIQLLLRRAGRTGEVSEQEREEARAIVLALGQFPLAIDQAGAYLEETECSLTDYLQLYQQHQYALLTRRGKQASGYPDSVATTWSLAFEQIEQSNPAAAELLRLCAFVAPDDIPEELLSEGAPYWPAALQEAARDRLRFNQLLSTLLAFSLLKRFGRERTLSLHRLVQVVQRERLTLEEQRQWTQRLVLAVLAVFPSHPIEIASWAACQRSLSQALVCAMLLEQHDLRLPEAAEVLTRAGVYLHERGLYGLAEPLLWRALGLREQLLGEAHPDVATSLHRLAILTRERGQYVQAEPLFQRALRIREQAWGDAHPNVAYVLDNLAILYAEQGQYAQAEPLFQRALRIWEQALGPEHPLVAYPLNNLGEFSREQGQYVQAEPLFQRALRIREQALGPEHPLVAYPLNNLALLSYEQGQYAQAEPLFQRALRIWEQALGPEHPNVAHPLQGLADLSREQGQYVQAEPLYQRALRIWEQALRPEHPQVAVALLGLADLSREQGQYAQAESLYQRALHIWEQRLPEHPLVVNILVGLARLSYEQGQSARTAQLCQQALRIWEHRLPEHPGIAFPLHYLALVAALEGKDEEAERLEWRALRIWEGRLGVEHPHVAFALHGLATLAARQGRESEAEVWFGRALSLREQQLGETHLKTAEVLHDFAGFQQARGWSAEAAIMYQRALTTREQVLGPDHPLTCDTRMHLQQVLVALGQAPETMPAEP